MKPIISKNCRIRKPELLMVKSHSIIDDFCYISARVEIGYFCHIASGCSIAGGKEFAFQMGDYCSLSSGVKIWCQSNDYVQDLIVIGLKGVDIGDKPIAGDVRIGSMCGVGSNAVIMPDNHIPEGVAIGALSFVPPRYSFEPWGVYAGTPLKRVGDRNRDRVLSQRDRLEEVLKENQKI